MKKVLLLAAAALGATAIAPQAALAQRDRGAHERQRDEDSPRWRGGDEGERRGREWRGQGAETPPPEQPQVRNWRPEQDRGGRGGDELAGGPWRGAPDNPPPPPPGFNGRNTPPAPAAQGNGGRDWRQGGDGERDHAQGQNQGWNGDRRRGQGQGWNGERGRGQGERQGWNGGRGEGERQGWNGERGRGEGEREGWNDGRGRGQGEHNGWSGEHGGGRGDHDGWNGERGRGDNHGWNEHGRGGRDWGRDGRRDWSDNDRWRHDWDRGRNDQRYRPYWNTHRDFSHPRYSDWRRIRHGYYFDRGYAHILSNYYGRNYYWWSYNGWHRPYRRWSIGYVIPNWLYWEDLPWDLYYRLPPAPYGCRYIYADGDVLLIAIASGIILDALLYEDDYY